jgi:hypothetical protein
MKILLLIFKKIIFWTFTLGNSSKVDALDLVFKDSIAFMLFEKELHSWLICFSFYLNNFTANMLLLSAAGSSGIVYKPSHTSQCNCLLFLECRARAMSSSISEIWVVLLIRTDCAIVALSVPEWQWHWGVL